MQPLLRPRALRIAKAQFSRAPTPAEASRSFLRNQNGVPPSSPARSKVGVQNRGLQTSHRDVSADDASHCTHRPLSIAIQFGPHLGFGALFLERIDRFIVRRLSLQARVVPHAYSPASAWPVFCLCLCHTVRTRTQLFTDLRQSTADFLIPAVSSGQKEATTAANNFCARCDQHRWDPLIQAVPILSRETRTVILLE